MAEGLPPSNGSGASSGLDIPAPNFVEQGKAQAIGMQQGGWWERHWASFWASIWSGLTLIMSVLVDEMDKILAIFIKVMGTAQGNNTAGFFQLLAALLSDLLGVEFSEAAVQAAWQRGGSMAAFRQIGTSYWNTLVKQLGSPASLTPEGGLAAAEGFMAYLLGFSVRESNISTILSLIPEEYRIVDGIEEYGHSMQRNLGFGRMARQALHPLIQTLITDPLQWYVNKVYHPKRMGESLAIKAWSMGAVQDADLATELLYAGYDPSLTDILKNEYSGKLSVSDVEKLSAAGKMDEASAIYAIRQSGVQEGTAALMLDAERRRAADGAVQELVVDIRNDFVNGYIDANERDGLWGNLGLPQVQLALLQFEANTRASMPRRRLTLAEVQSAFVEGLVDSTYLKTFLGLEGYSPDDQLTLYYQTLMKLGTQEAKVAVAQYTYNKAVAKAQAAGEPVPPPPAILAGSPVTPTGGLSL